MGDIIELIKVELLYGYLYQFDWHNKTQNTRFRTFCEVKDITDATGLYAEKLVKEKK